MAAPAPYEHRPPGARGAFPIDVGRGGAGLRSVASGAGARAEGRPRSGALSTVAFFGHHLQGREELAQYYSEAFVARHDDRAWGAHPDE